MNSKQLHNSSYPLLREQALDRTLSFVLLASMAVAFLLLPTWTVQYVPLYDYQNHLLEAQVVVEYAEPKFEYAAHYQLRENWWLRSNALSTLVMIWLGQILPMETAGKAALSVYFVLLTGGMALLLARLDRPAFLLLALPMLAYNFTYTMGLLNWSYGFALLPWAAWLYLGWQEKGSVWSWIGLAGCALLIYLAHVLAWGLLLLVLFTLASAERLSLTRWTALAAAASSAAPMLLMTRPFLALAPLGLAAVLWMLGELVRRIRLRPWMLVAAGAVMILLFFTAFSLAREPLREIFPDVGYSPYGKAFSFLQLFTLPHYSGAHSEWLEIYNWFVLLLAAGAAGLLLYQTWRCGFEFSSKGWAALVGLLAMAYFLIPSRTTDIITTEPRIFLVGIWAALLAAHIPQPGTRARTALTYGLALLAVLIPAAAWLHAVQYDRAAQRWAAQLANIPPRQRVLVFSDPLPTLPTLLPFRLEQVFDQHQFANTYALEQGGFTSTTFFNGPLQSYDPRAIPPYWWDDFRAASYLDQYCERLSLYYDIVAVWNPRSQRLLQSLERCYGEAVWREAELGLWRR
jgi:hypothetical protein